MIFKHFRFCVGDRFYLHENKILCEYDYEERMVFANLPYNINSISLIKRQTQHIHLQQQHPQQPPHQQHDDRSSGYGSTDSVFDAKWRQTIATVPQSPQWSDSTSGYIIAVVYVKHYRPVKWWNKKETFFTRHGDLKYRYDSEKNIFENSVLLNVYLKTFVDKFQISFPILEIWKIKWSYEC